MNIDWKEGAVCCADGEQWFVNFNSDRKKYQLKNFGGGRLFSFYGVINFAKNFQLNTIKQGDYIETSGLNTEQEYNDAVEVFRLFGFALDIETAWGYSRRGEFKVLVCCNDGLWQATSDNWNKRKLTYPQLMAIGELKRMMNEREKSPIDVSGFNTVEQSIEKRAKRNKARQAYKILNDLDYEYDLVKQKWYKKQYV